MDRRRTRLGGLAAWLGLLAALGCAVPAAPPEPPAAGALPAAAAPLREAAWLSAEADMVAALTRRPAECMVLPDDPQARASVEIGRAAFRTPLLLGGQAARAGLSCAACHRAGHSNPDFVFPGLSGAPGTADVTSALMSEVRGDGAFNPRPIPSLVAGHAAPAVPRDPDTGALETFIHGLTVEEFAGAPPPPAVLDGLAAYIRAMSRAACPAPGETAITLAADMADARRALAAAAYSLEKGDAPTGRLMIAAVRSALERIDERFAGPEFAAQREALRSAASELGAIRAAASDAPQEAARRLQPWPARLDALERRLAPGEAQSFYAPDRLAEALGLSPAPR